MSEPCSLQGEPLGSYEFETFDPEIPFLHWLDLWLVKAFVRCSLLLRGTKAHVVNLECMCSSGQFPVVEVRAYELMDFTDMDTG